MLRFRNLLTLLSNQTSNVDRLFAIWQDLHDVPGAQDPYVSQQVTAGGTFITSANATEDVRTPLAPFYQNGADFWDSAGVRTTHIFGYAYPETQDWLHGGDAAAYRESIVEALKSTYPEGSFAELVRAERAGSAAPARLLRARAETLAQVAQADAPASTATLLQVADQKKKVTSAPPAAADRAPPPPTIASPPPASSVIRVPSVQLPADRNLAKLAPANQYLEWLVNLRVQKYVLGGDFTVHVFLGPVEEDSTVLYPVSPYHVGTFSTFGQKEDTQVS